MRATVLKEMLVAKNQFPVKIEQVLIYSTVLSFVNREVEMAYFQFMVLLLG
jgi:hypothetical protein